MIFSQKTQWEIAKLRMEQRRQEAIKRDAERKIEALQQEIEGLERGDSENGEVVACHFCGLFSCDSDCVS